MNFFEFLDESKIFTGTVDGTEAVQGKHNIPVHQQRLTFAPNHSPISEINLFKWNSTTDDHTAHVPVVADFITCLQSWEAIL